MARPSSSGVMRGRGARGGSGINGGSGASAVCTPVLPAAGALVWMPSPPVALACGPPAGVESFSADMEKVLKPG